MSDYRHKQAVRARCAEGTISSLGFKNLDDFFDGFDDYVKEKCVSLSKYDKKENGEYQYNPDKPYFEAIYFEDGVCIDLTIVDEEGSGEFAVAKRLNKEEGAFFVEKFRQLGISVTAENLRKVDYCWYDGVEPPACFEEKDKNYIDLFIQKGGK